MSLPACGPQLSTNMAQSASKHQTNRTPAESGKDGPPARRPGSSRCHTGPAPRRLMGTDLHDQVGEALIEVLAARILATGARSEERRVGKVLHARSSQLDG